MERSNKSRTFVIHEIDAPQMLQRSTRTLADSRVQASADTFHPNLKNT
jgi:hypothetical protein